MARKFLRETDELIISTAVVEVVQRIGELIADHSPIVQVNALAWAAGEAIARFTHRDVEFARKALRLVTAQVADLMQEDGLDIAGDPLLDPVIEAGAR